MLVPPERSRERRDPWSLIEAANRRYLEVYRDNYALISNWEQVAAFDTSFRKLLWEWGNDRFIDERRATSAGRARASQTLRSTRCRGARAESHGHRFAYVMFSMQEPHFDFEEAVQQLTRLWANSIGVDGPKRQPVSRRGRRHRSGVAASSRDAGELRLPLLEEARDSLRHIGPAQ